MPEVAVLIVGLLLNGLGILGCIVPALPGPLLSWLSLFLFFLLPEHEVSSTTLVVTGLLMALVTALDYVVPVLGAKKFGSSKEGVWGGMIGIVVGLFFFPPVGIILGPLLGTIIGDLIAGGTFTKALNSGIGSLLGFIVGTSIKLIYSIGVLTLFTIKAGGAIGQLFTQWFS
ncbi:MAG: DUF456 domain-containing protein [Flavobacteriales bacterium]|nr:DUF456 domain-containing protein [Flavobacteriales bacterium]